MTDHAGITEVVLRERTGRDTARWDTMASAFAPVSDVQLSWFSGTGEEFVAASRRMHERGSRSFHTIGAVSAATVGERALASENCTVHTTATLAGVELNLASHGRLYQRLVRADNEWRIRSLTMLYYQDVATLANPADDPSPLASYPFPVDRPYRYLAAILAEAGYPVSPDLPGPDRPELAEAYLAAHETWLHARDRDLGS